MMFESSRDKELLNFVASLCFTINREARQQIQNIEKQESDERSKHTDEVIKKAQEAIKKAQEAIEKKRLDAQKTSWREHRPEGTVYVGELIKNKKRRPGRARKPPALRLIA